MFAGVALGISQIPVYLIHKHGLKRRAYQRGGEEEIQFLLNDRERVLPVWYEGRLQILRWGMPRLAHSALPTTAWTWRSTVEEGSWNALEPQLVSIPASMGVDRGVWFRIREGIRGLVVRDEQQHPVVYVLVEPATHYYKIMTRSEWMPCLVGETI
ncbi:MAG: hypothetical protein SNJ75_17835 [Gemmataceae bacterium]